MLSTSAVQVCCVPGVARSIQLLTLHLSQSQSWSVGGGTHLCLVAGGWSTTKAEYFRRHRSVGAGTWHRNQSRKYLSSRDNSPNYFPWNHDQNVRRSFFSKAPPKKTPSLSEDKEKTEVKEDPAKTKQSVFQDKSNSSTSPSSATLTWVTNIITLLLHAHWFP